MEQRNDRCIASLLYPRIQNHSTAVIHDHQYPMRVLADRGHQFHPKRQTTVKSYVFDPSHNILCLIASLTAPEPVPINPHAGFVMRSQHAIIFWPPDPTITI